MRNKKFKLCTVLLLGIGLSGLSAQVAMPASGGNASGSGGTLSYSVGQVVYTTYTGTNGSLLQGVQQPYEITVVTGLKKTEGITLKYLVYPNPTKDFIKLKVENYNNENLSYLLFDLNGKLLETKKLAGSETTINLNGLVLSEYLLKVTDNNKEIKTFKIVKN